MLQQVFLLAVVAMIGLALLRLARVHRDHSPLPEGRGRTVFLVAFLVVPPFVLGALSRMAAGQDPVGGIAWVPLYVPIVAGLALLMVIAAIVVEIAAPRRSRRLLLVALIGSEGDPNSLAFDPPVTTKLVETMALVDRRNAAFPRGREFAAEVDRAGFRSDWDALDSATHALEGRMAEDRRLGLGVASQAVATALDARTRLDTLGRLATDRGPAAAV